MLGYVACWATAGDDDFDTASAAHTNASSAALESGTRDSAWKHAPRAMHCDVTDLFAPVAAAAMHGTRLIRWRRGHDAASTYASSTARVVALHFFHGNRNLFMRNVAKVATFNYPHRYIERCTISVAAGLILITRKTAPTTSQLAFREFLLST